MKFPRSDRRARRDTKAVRVSDPILTAHPRQQPTQFGFVEIEFKKSTGENAFRRAVEKDTIYAFAS